MTKGTSISGRQSLAFWPRTRLAHCVQCDCFNYTHLVPWTLYTSSCSLLLFFFDDLRLSFPFFFLRCIPCFYSNPARVPPYIVSPPPWALALTSCMLHIFDRHAEKYFSSNRSTVLGQRCTESVQPCLSKSPPHVHSICMSLSINCLFQNPDITSEIGIRLDSPYQPVCDVLIKTLESLRSSPAIFGKAES